MPTEVYIERQKEYLGLYHWTNMEIECWEFKYYEVENKNKLRILDNKMKFI